MLSEINILRPRIARHGILVPHTGGQPTRTDPAGSAPLEEPDAYESKLDLARCKWLRLEALVVSCGPFADAASR